MTDFEQAKDAVLEFRDMRNWEQFHNPKDLAISISLEAAELLEHFQWSGDDCICAERTDGQIEELADVFIYCILLANRLGVDPAEIVLTKVKKNSAKYPVEKAYGSSLKYTEFDS